MGKSFWRITYGIQYLLEVSSILTLKYKIPLVDAGQIQVPPRRATKNGCKYHPKTWLYKVNSVTSWGCSSNNDHADMDRLQNPIGCNQHAFICFQKNKNRMQWIIINWCVSVILIILFTNEVGGSFCILVWKKDRPYKNKIVLLMDPQSTNSNPWIT